MREIKEEVDLGVEIQGLLCMAETIRPGHEEHWVSAIYEVSVKSGEARNMELGLSLNNCLRNWNVSQYQLSNIYKKEVDCKL